MKRYGVQPKPHKLNDYSALDDRELSDLQEDPSEMTNLRHQPLPSERGARLKKRLADLRLKLADHTGKDLQGAKSPSLRSIYLE